ncbi:hypothetical protein DY000_02034519 [Brassica cretica]|uniref:PIN domain-containing protein n=1 Tax=Brassica cretica TaxID=69181 RepID=A0ABQ7DHL3_BRACR|nr:hypothetical protein DY000_02034519 [Brassica cretica]
MQCKGNVTALRRQSLIVTVWGPATIPETRGVDSLCMWGRSWRMSYSHQKRAGKARLELICESSRKAAALHAKINGKELDKPDITQTCEEILNPSVPVALSLTGILMGKQFRISWLGGIVDERKVVKQHLLEDVTSLRVEETNGAWRTKAIPDPTLLPQGRTYARKEAVTLLKKADFGNFDQKWQHKEKQRAGSGEGGNTGACQLLKLTAWSMISDDAASLLFLLLTQSPYLTLENFLHHQLLCLLTITDYAHELLVLHASSLVFEASPLMALPSSALNISGSSASNIDLDFIGFIVQLLFISSISLMLHEELHYGWLHLILLILFSFLLLHLDRSEHGSKQDIGSSSTNKSYVDSKGRYVDQFGFTWIGTPKIDDESTPPGVKSTPPGVKETAIDAFVDMETLKFTSTENVFLLRPQISTILDAMGDDTVKYKLVNINSFLIQGENNFAKSVNIVSNFSKIYPPRRLVCGPCKQDSRNLPAGEKKPLLDLEMIRKISVYAMTPGRKPVVIISNDLYLTSTFADKLRAQYNELTVITPSVGCMIPVAMYREKTDSDVRPRNVQRGARNVQRGGD